MLLQILTNTALVIFLLFSTVHVYGGEEKQSKTVLIPIENFFENPDFSNAVISPEGDFVAVVIGKKDIRQVLAVYDISKAEVKIIARFREYDIGYFQWISNQRIVFELVDRESAVGDIYEGPGLFAVNADGSEYRQLINQTNEPAVNSNGFILPSGARLLRKTGNKNSNSVFLQWPTTISNDNEKQGHVALMKLNTITQAAEEFDASEAPTGTIQWVLDQEGNPRVVLTRDKNINTIGYFDLATKEWRKIAEFDIYKGGQNSFTPWGFSPTGQLLCVASKEKDKSALYTFDLTTERLSEKPIFSLDHYDFTGDVITTSEEILGVRYQTDADETYWFDSTMAELQKRIDKKLPHTINRMSIGTRSKTPYLLIAAHSDVQPTVYLIYDRNTDQLNKIGETHKNINPMQMGRQEMIRYKARDGLDIPAFLSIPTNVEKNNLPLVVLVHGGPYVRGKTWGWNAETQFLTSRGYAVLEPEFRGSTGFGRNHFQSGWKQWGLAMQDDIADGALWAIQNGIADPKRICIAGASYGGYAALMGVVRNPELFQCAFEWLGVTDIGLMFNGYKGSDSDLPETWKKYGMPTLIADPITDATQIRETSPISQAKKIKRPLLLGYGGADRRVPIYHGTLFRDAIKKHNSEVEWIKYTDEGHGWRLVKTRLDFWSRVEHFLDRHIGKKKDSEGIHQ